MTIHTAALLSLKADRYDKDDRDNRSAFAHMYSISNASYQCPENRSLLTVTTENINLVY
jgi:hypothetical protein